MKTIVRPLLSIAIAALSSATVVVPFQASQAATFGRKEVDQSKIYRSGVSYWGWRDSSAPHY